MSEQEWRRIEYNTWDEAFRGLAPIIRQQSVRIAEYTQVMFLGACSGTFGKDSAEGEQMMRGQYADAAYKCGLYHQLGKALVAPDYQIWQKDFTKEETELYRKYTTDGRFLVAHLQEKGAREKVKRKGSFSEIPTKNIPWLMMRQSCEQHMERYDGTGYPKGLTGRNISPIAQIVGLAKELDRLSAEKKSEHPFDEALGLLVSQSGTKWDPELVAVLTKCADKCREIYEKYIYYTLTVPQTIPLVVKNPDRPLGLKYRPIASNAYGAIGGYDAIPWFGGIAGRPGETESFGELEEMLKRTDTLNDVTFYFIYEATDLLYRLQNCKINVQGVILPMLPSFYKQSSQIQRFEEVFENQPVEREKLILTVPEELLIGATKTLEELFSRYIRKGISLVVDGYHPDALPFEHLKEIGFDRVRLAADVYGKTDTAETIRQLKANGFHVYCADVPDAQTLQWLAVCGAELLCGPLAGILSDEDDIIRDALGREQ